MNPEWEEKWITALRSGDYRQGHGLLRESPSEFCCLGVLCDLVDANRWRNRDGNWVFSETTGRSYVVEMPPADVYLITGLSEDVARQYSEMNDQGNTFEQIAICIEEQA